MPKPLTKNHQIAQLRAQLEEEQKSSAALRQTIITQKITLDNTLDQLKVAEETLIRARSTSTFQKKLPTEIRMKIYKSLLVNQKLSEIESIGKASNHGKSLKFELTPAILQTCKAIQNEAEPILYGSNIFIMECIGGCGPMGCFHVPQSPLTRYTDPKFELDYLDAENEMGSNMGMVFSGTEIHFDFNTFKALKKVKHWRIITSTYAPTPSNPVPAKSFVHFCQALCQQAPTRPQRSINIVLALAKFPVTPVNPKSEEAHEAQTVEVNLERFMNLAPPIVQKYYALVEDLSPIEKVFKMHKRLEDYAVCVERSERFNEDMFTLQRGCEASFSVREVRHFGWQLPRPSLGNPFKGLTHSSYHPVELAFSRAIIAKDKEDVIEFKAARASVLGELEPQYERMMHAANRLRDFVEKERRKGVFSECDGCGVFHQYEEDPFESTLGDDLDRYIYELEEICYSAYLNKEREKLFRRLRWMQTQDHLRDPSRTASQIARWARKLVEDMWDDCGLASWRREQLFEDDTTDIGCKINKKLGEGLLDEELEWSPQGLDNDDEFYYMHGHYRV
ncbi:hypothetical protein DID88_005944 [Monilinia fructigena]|uniref:Uncharacterized protein n=1 Tax=Monilinia fructigena TaxID=38457 RepID=A0A395J3J6_9HELO|nr:hypothetical protein DID88_005944 [Monilinia fructigena]